MLRQLYRKSVFINCPFSEEYLPLFEAIVFTVYGLGFVPRSTKEIDGWGGVRIMKIVKIISECQYSVHDISHTELDPNTNLPRFNMPFELGIDVGCRYLGDKLHAEKSHLIMDRTPYRYQKFISDLAGADLQAHGNNKNEVIKIVRHWLSTASYSSNLPSAAFLQAEYKVFLRQFPKIRKHLGLGAEISYMDYSHIVVNWLKERHISMEGKREDDSNRPLRILQLFADTGHDNH